jgi:hypothetical protein
MAVTIGDTGVAPCLQGTLASWRQEKLNGTNASHQPKNISGEASAFHMAPIHIAMEMRNVLMQTSDTTS